MATTPPAAGPHHPWRFELGLIGLGLAFAALTVLVIVRPLLAIDVTIEQAVQSFDPPWMAVWTEAVSWLGFPPQSTLIDGLIIVLIFWRGRRWAALTAAFAAATSAGVWFAIAPLVHRPRPTPDLVRVMAEIPFGGFPSGHVLNLTAFFGCLAYLAWVLLRPSGVRWLAELVCGALIASIGFARVYSGEHWPSDVLAGYLLGVVCLWASIHLYRWGCRRGWGEPRGNRFTTASRSGWTAS